MPDVWIVALNSNAARDRLRNVALTSTKWHLSAALIGQKDRRAANQPQWPLEMGNLNEPESWRPASLVVITLTVAQSSADNHQQITPISSWHGCKSSGCLDKRPANRALRHIRPSQLTGFLLVTSSGKCLERKSCCLCLVLQNDETTLTTKNCAIISAPFHSGSLLLINKTSGSTLFDLAPSFEHWKAAYANTMAPTLVEMQWGRFLIGSNHFCQSWWCQSGLTFELWPGHLTLEETWQQNRYENNQTIESLCLFARSLARSLATNKQTLRNFNSTSTSNQTSTRDLRVAKCQLQTIGRN